MSENEFVPCSPNCQTCKSDVFKDPGAMRWQPTDEPYPFGPYDGPKPRYHCGGWVSGITGGDPLIDLDDPPGLVVLASVARRIGAGALAALEESARPAPKPVPVRPRLAGLIRRLWP